MVYVVTFTTESGDSGVLGVYNSKPSDDQILSEIVDRMPADVEDNTLYIRWEVSKEEIKTPYYPTLKYSDYDHL